MTKRKRFYLHDVAACMGVDVSRLRLLCQYWEVAAHGVHEFEDMQGQQSWLIVGGCSENGTEELSTTRNRQDGF